jgi:hypothetical protein
MMDYPETSRNLRQPAVEVSDRFPNFSINKFFFEKKHTNKKFGNLLETWRKPVGNLRCRFPEVSG